MAEETILNNAERERIESVIELCRTAQGLLQSGASFRLRVLLDMTLLELVKELERKTGDRAA